MTNQEKQDILDQEHLRLLRIGFIVGGGADALVALVMLLYVLIGFVIVGAGAAVPTRPGEPSPALFGMFFVVFGLVMTFGLGGLSALKLSAARALGKRRSKLLIQVAAACACLQMPWGVLLGVFTFLVLGRDSVKRLFEDGAPAQLGAAPVRAGRSLFDDEEAQTAEPVESRRA